MSNSFRCTPTPRHRSADPLVRPGCSRAGVCLSTDDPSCHRQILRILLHMHLCNYAQAPPKLLYIMLCLSCCFGLLPSKMAHRYWNLASPSATGSRFPIIETSCCPSFPAHLEVPERPFPSALLQLPHVLPQGQELLIVCIAAHGDHGTRGRRSGHRAGTPEPRRSLQSRAARLTARRVRGEPRSFPQEDFLRPSQERTKHRLFMLVCFFHVPLLKSWHVGDGRLAAIHLPPFGGALGW